LSGARLTDGKGQTVDFGNVILIFTSNIGGAEAHEKHIGPDAPYPEVETHFKTEVARFFAEDLGRPEIFGRVKHGVVVFRYIGEDTAREALVLRLSHMAEGVRKRFGNHVEFPFAPSATPPNDDRKVVDELLARCGYQEFGLRDINNVIRERVGGGLARRMEDLAARIAGGKTGFRVRFRWNATEEKVEVVI
jgi:ATP-dependent Clp protease ATP-binding subunit ClpA